MSEVINIKELNERIERESVFVDTLRMPSFFVSSVTGGGLTRVVMFAVPFLLPLMSTAPRNGTPPLMRKLSMIF